MDIRRHTKRIGLYLAFYKSTLKVSLPISLLFGYIISRGYPEESANLEFIKCTLLTLSTIGLAVDLIYKYLTKREEYYFYHNYGITEYQLYIVSALIPFVFYLIISIVL